MSRILPFPADFGLEPSPEPATAADAVFEEEFPNPLGVDYGFDPVTKDLSTTLDGDLRVIDEEPAFAQWCMVCIGTDAGTEIIYSTQFGSTISELVGSGFPREVIDQELKEALQNALANHDRIASVDDLQVRVSQRFREPLYFSATVVRDDDERLEFEGIA